MSPGAHVVVQLAPVGGPPALAWPEVPGIEWALARSEEEALRLLSWHPTVAVVVLLPYPGRPGARVVSSLGAATGASVVAISEQWTPAEETAIRAAGAVLCLTPDRTADVLRLVRHSLARAVAERP